MGQQDGGTGELGELGELGERIRALLCTLPAWVQALALQAVPGTAPEVSCEQSQE